LGKPKLGGTDIAASLFAGEPGFWQAHFRGNRPSGEPSSEGTNIKASLLDGEPSEGQANLMENLVNGAGKPVDWRTTKEAKPVSWGTDFRAEPFIKGTRERGEPACRRTVCMASHLSGKPENGRALIRVIQSSGQPPHG